MSHDIFLFVDSLGWALLHSVWQGIVVWILFSVTQHLLAQSAPHLRHINALMWLLILLILPITTCVVYYSHAITPLASPGALLPTMGNIWSPHWFDSNGLSMITNSFPVLVSLWFATLVCLSLRTLCGWNNVAKLSLQGCFPIPKWQPCLQQLVSIMGVRVHVRLRESIHVHVPMVVGWIKPVVLVPSSALLGLSPRELELIIAHELAHIRRLDYVSNYLLVLTENVLFYHPVVYAITRVIREERELCCDDLVIDNCGDRLHYVRALAKLEALRGQAENNLSGLQLAATDGPLLMRIRRIVTGAQQRSTGALFVGIIALSTVAAGGLSSWLLTKESHRYTNVQPLPAKNVYTAVVELAFNAHSHPDKILGTGIDDVFANVPARQQPLEKSLDFVEDVLITKRRSDESFQKIRAELQRQIATEHPAMSLTIEYAAPDLAWDTDDSAELVRIDPAIILDQFDARTLLPKSETLATMVRHTLATQIDPVEPVSTDAYIHAAVPDQGNVIDAQVPVTGHNTGERSEAIEGGALIRQVQPRYPKHARLRGKEGSVQVEMHVDRAGNVTHAKVVSEDSNPLFERSVLHAVSQWSFEPMLRGGEPIERTVKQLFDFRFAS